MLFSHLYYFAQVTEPSATNAILALIVALFFPAIGTFMAMANSNKFMAMGGKIFSGLGKRASRVAMGNAKGKITRAFDRSGLGKALKLKEHGKDIQAQTDFVKKDSSIMKRIAGGKEGSERRQTLDAYLIEEQNKVNQREQAAHGMYVTPQAADMALAMERDGYDQYTENSNGDLVWTDSKDRTRRKVVEADARTKKGLQYIATNNLTKSKNGATALAQSLIDSGKADKLHIKQIAQHIEDLGDRGDFVENARSHAQQKGMDHLKYMTMEPGGDIDFAGATHSGGAGSRQMAIENLKKRGEDHTNIENIEREKEKVEGSRVGGRIYGAGPDINKYIFDTKDEALATEYFNNLVSDETSTERRGAFETMIARMEDEKIEKMAAMFARTEDGRSMFSAGYTGKADDKEAMETHAKKLAIDHYKRERALAKEKHHM